MKRILIYLLTAALVSSCSYENNGSLTDTPCAVPEGYVRLMLSVSRTKTQMNGLDVHWQKGDKILVNGVPYPIADIASGLPSVVVPQASRYEAFYPADIACADSVLVPNNQYYSYESFGQNCEPLFCSTDGDLCFDHLFGILKLTVAGKGRISSISIRDNAGSPLSGVFRLSDGNLQAGTNVHDYVTLVCVDKKSCEAVSIDEKGRNFHVCIPPGTYADGFTLTISGDDGRSMVLVSHTPRTIRKGEILETPVIDYSPDKDQIFFYHFDSMAYGGHPGAEVKGFANPEFSCPSGFAFANQLCDASSPGSGIISTAWEVGKSAEFPKSYLNSRNLQHFALLYNVRECRGCLGLGIDGDSRAIFRTPRFSAIPSGKVCKAVLSFKMAFEKNATESIQVYPQWEGTGIISEYWVDGVRIPIPMNDETRWCRGDGLPGIGDVAGKSTLGTNTILLVKPSDFGDDGWHDVRIVLGAVTNKTWINFQALTKGSVQSGFYLDNLCAEISEYPYQHSGSSLSPAIMISAYNQTAMKWLEAQGTALGIRYVDLYLSNSYLHSTLSADRGLWDSTFASWKTMLDRAGVKVNAVHLPYDELPGILEDNITELSANYDIREKAVANLADIMTHLAPLGVKFYVAHPRRNKNLDWDEFKTYLKESCISLTAVASSIGATFCLENMPGPSSSSICADVSHLDWLCSQVPGLKVCFDTSHAIVGGRTTCQAALSALGMNVATVHIHDGDTQADIHLPPAYRGLYTAQSATIDWPAVMRALIDDCSYSGCIMYEMATYSEDTVISYNYMTDNYYTVLLPAINNR